jgi:homoserine O-succinyltransferase/O-acetyltransferase
VILDSRRSLESNSTKASSSSRRRLVRVALVNNMPLSAFAATTKQFNRLLTSAAGELEIALDVFVLPNTPDAAAKLARPGVCAESVAKLKASKVDALITTGCEPVCSRVQDEAYWSELADLVSWSKDNTISSLWSCLAAHAAVSSLSGVERRPLPNKQSGIYACDIVSDHRLIRGATSPAFVPHSRMNELPEADLRAHGFQILTKSPTAGVDAFVKQAGASLALFLQGHPEYEEQSLLFEFRRDLERWMRRENPSPPGVPENYFDRTDHDALMRGIRTAAETGDFDPLRMLAQGVVPRGFTDWRPWSVRLVGNWLQFIAEMKFESAGAMTRSDVSV